MSIFSTIITLLISIAIGAGLFILFDMWRNRKNNKKAENSESSLDSEI